MKKITRRNFLIASGKTVGTLAAASAFMGCASPEQAENCFPRSAMPVRTDDRLTAIDDIVENYMGQGYFPGATIVVARGGKIVYEKAYGYAMLNDMGVRLDDPRPMQMDTMFDMASCTKIMATTQSIMKQRGQDRPECHGSKLHSGVCQEREGKRHRASAADPHLRSAAVEGDVPPHREGQGQGAGLHLQL